MSIELREQLRCGANPYGATLADNINKSYANISARYGNGNLYLYLPDSWDKSTVLKPWLDKFLKTQPQINCPLERLQVIVYLHDAIQLVSILNPSELDAMEMDEDNSKARKFRHDYSQDWKTPMPLTHPWYKDKNYFKNSR
ncbi:MULTISPECIES: hypothetical protein [unclassified Pedobacter]|uniref:hypothetical protein n=1 Tax=unclassified Pedobacter TaxID=2628915 RepID=UPI001E2877C5|nr:MULTISPECIES: hypothetical protein [unclassified Pedobacter]